TSSGKQQQQQQQQKQKQQQQQQQQQQSLLCHPSSNFGGGQTGNLCTKAGAHPPAATSLSNCIAERGPCTTFSSSTSSSISSLSFDKHANVSTKDTNEYNKPSNSTPKQNHKRLR